MAAYSVGTFGYDYKGFERYEAAYLMSEFDVGNFLTIIQEFAGRKIILVMMVRDMPLFNPVKLLSNHLQSLFDLIKLGRINSGSLWLI